MGSPPPKEYPIRVELGLWSAGELRRLGTIHQRDRAPNETGELSIYVQVGPPDSQQILSFHASGQFNQKVRGGEALEIGLGEDGLPFADRPPERAVWKMPAPDHPTLSSAPIAVRVRTLRRDELSRLLLCDFQPEIVFILTAPPENLGVAFFGVSDDCRMIPWPTRNVSVGFTWHVTPPMAVYADSSGGPDVLVGDPPEFVGVEEYDVPPTPAFCKVGELGYQRVVCFPSPPQKQAFRICVLKDQSGVPDALVEALCKLPARPAPE